MINKEQPTLLVISYWENLKKMLISDDCNIYCDEEIEKIDHYFHNQLKNELYGK